MENLRRYINRFQERVGKNGFLVQNTSIEDLYTRLDVFVKEAEKGKKDSEAFKGISRGFSDAVNENDKIYKQIWQEVSSLGEFALDLANSFEKVKELLGDKEKNKYSLEEEELILEKLLNFIKTDNPEAKFKTLRDNLEGAIAQLEVKYKLAVEAGCLSGVSEIRDLMVRIEDVIQEFSVSSKLKAFKSELEKLEEDFRKVSDSLLGEIESSLMDDRDNLKKLIIFTAEEVAQEANKSQK